MQEIHKGIERAIEGILADYQSDRAIDKMDVYRRPDRDAIIDIIKKSLKYNLIRYYYSDSIDTSRIKESLTNSFFNFIGGTVYNRKSYYEEIFDSRRKQYFKPSILRCQNTHK